MIPVVIDKSFFPRSAGGGIKIKSRLQSKIQGAFFDRARIQRMLGKANAVALSKASRNIWQGAKKGIGNKSPSRSKKWMAQLRAAKPIQIGGGLYRDSTPYNSGKPRAAGQPVKSWGPRRLLYRSLRYYVDKRRQSAVIGPEFIRWLVMLHEYGGPQRMRAYGLRPDLAEIAYKRQKRGRPLPTWANGTPKLGTLLWSSRRIKTGRLWTDLGKSRVVRYPARPFMGSGSVRGAIKRLPDAFRNTIRGPGI